jgi:hypothetical protein
MEQDLHTDKTPARPSQGATDPHDDATEVGKSEQHRIDHIANQMAERANNRIKSNEDSSPGDGIFTK